MRFKKGSKVEVLSRNDGPFGSWRCGEIVFSGNGHTFIVRYDFASKQNSEDIVERVSRKAIRPCPPPVDDVLDSWTSGDLVEVFENFSWTTASILKVICPNYYLVKLIGSSRELQRHIVDIRVRQLWQDGKWIVIGKGSGSLEDLKRNRLSALSCYQKTSNSMLHIEAGENRLAVENNADFWDSCIMTARTLKRASPFWSSNGKASRIRAMEKKSECQVVMSGCSASFLKKVDAVVFPQERLGAMYMHTSPNNQTIASYEGKRGSPNYFVESFQSRSLKPNDSDIDQCSVGSCSVIRSNPSKLCSPTLACNNCDEDSDAESFYTHQNEEEKCYPSLGENVAVRIHSLELHAYRCTLEALYASGPLNWEQEVLLTNLRISLNISNDEHLMELRNLISSTASINIR